MNEVLCKWVSKNMTTMKNTKWEVGVPNELPEQDDLKLCKQGLFHYVTHPLLAVMFKDYHACNRYANLYKVEPSGTIVKEFDKCGATKLTLVKKLEIPEVTLEQRISFGILCALEVYKEPRFVDWANKWLNGEDRSERSAINIAQVKVARKNIHIAKYAAWNVAANGFSAADVAYWSVYFSELNKTSCDLISIAKKATKII